MEWNPYTPVIIQGSGRNKTGTEILWLGRNDLQIVGLPLATFDDRIGIPWQHCQIGFQRNLTGISNIFTHFWTKAFHLASYTPLHELVYRHPHLIPPSVFLLPSFSLVSYPKNPIPQFKHPTSWMGPRQCQRPFLEFKLEVPTINRAYVRAMKGNLWRNLHFRVR